ncbi:hypothetical protein CEXT_274681 [Caerostris extrusa]|uniref:C2H2-type domain-containing protein n=1 Tax=Caerostris extrusa TaxID=172846 RepID=A0AAV4RCJ6_CAEEX|nr:hypothetical protein CEXT_274681 [Caerostris extrusa]
MFTLEPPLISRAFSTGVWTTSPGQRFANQGSATFAPTALIRRVDCMRPLAYSHRRETSRLPSLGVVYQKDSRFKCSLCNYVAHSSGNLLNHTRKHTGERPFQCPVCAKGFTQKGNAQRHMTMHFAQSKEICPICKVRYTREERAFRTSEPAFFSI